MIRRGLVPLAVACYAPMAALAAIAMVARDGREVVALRVLAGTPALEILLGTLCGSMVVVACRLAWRLSSWWRACERVFVRTLGKLSPGECVVLALASGIGEEMLFRGALQPALGLPLTALLFGVVHVPFARGLLVWPLFALAAGVLLGWLFDRHGSLLAPVSCHVVINGVNLWIIARRAGAEELPSMF